MGLFNHLFKNKPPQGDEKMEGGPHTTPEGGADAVDLPPDPSVFLHPKAYVPRGAATPVLPGGRPMGQSGGRPIERRAFQPDPPTAGEIILTLGDVLSRIPTQLLKEGPQDPKRELRFKIGDLSSDIARGRAVVPLSRIAALCPDIFRRQPTAAEDMDVRLPLQKLVEQIGLMRSNPPAPLPAKTPPPAQSDTPSSTMPTRAPLSMRTPSTPPRQTAQPKVELKPSTPGSLPPNAFELKPRAASPHAAPPEISQALRENILKAQAVPARRVPAENRAQTPPPKQEPPSPEVTVPEVGSEVAPEKQPEPQLEKPPEVVVAKADNVIPFPSIAARTGTPKLEQESSESSAERALEEKLRLLLEEKAAGESSMQAELMAPSHLVTALAEIAHQQSLLKTPEEKEAQAEDVSLAQPAGLESAEENLAESAPHLFRVESDDRHEAEALRPEAPAYPLIDAAAAFKKALAAEAESASFVAERIPTEEAQPKESETKKAERPAAEASEAALRDLAKPKTSDGIPKLGVPAALPAESFQAVTPAVKSELPAAQIPVSAASLEKNPETEAPASPKKKAAPVDAVAAAKIEIAFPTFEREAAKPVKPEAPSQRKPEATLEALAGTEPAIGVSKSAPPLSAIPEAPRAEVLSKAAELEKPKLSVAESFQETPKPAALVSGTVPNVEPVIPAKAEIPQSTTPPREAKTEKGESKPRRREEAALKQLAKQKPSEKSAPKEEVSVESPGELPQEGEASKSAELENPKLSVAEVFKGTFKAFVSAVLPKEIAATGDPALSQKAETPQTEAGLTETASGKPAGELPPFDEGSLNEMPEPEAPEKPSLQEGISAGIPLEMPAAGPEPKTAEPEPPKISAAEILKDAPKTGPIEALPKEIASTAQSIPPPKTGIDQAEALAKEPEQRKTEVAATAAALKELEQTKPQARQALKAEVEAETSAPSPVESPHTESTLHASLQEKSEVGVTPVLEQTILAAAAVTLPKAIFSSAEPVASPPSASDKAGVLPQQAETRKPEAVIARAGEPALPELAQSEAAAPPFAKTETPAGSDLELGLAETEPKVPQPELAERLERSEVSAAQIVEETRKTTRIASPPVLMAATAEAIVAPEADVQQSEAAPGATASSPLEVKAAQAEVSAAQILEETRKAARIASPHELIAATTAAVTAPRPGVQQSKAAPSAHEVKAEPTSEAAPQNLAQPHPSPEQFAETETPADLLHAAVVSKPVASKPPEISAAAVYETTLPADAPSPPLEQSISKPEPIAPAASKVVASEAVLEEAAKAASEVGPPVVIEEIAKTIVAPKPPASGVPRSKVVASAPAEIPSAEARVPQPDQKAPEPRPVEVSAKPSKQAIPAVPPAPSVASLPLVGRSKLEQAEIALHDQLPGKPKSVAPSARQRLEAESAKAPTPPAPPAAPLAMEAIHAEVTSSAPPSDLAAASHGELHPSHPPAEPTNPAAVPSKSKVEPKHAPAVAAASAAQISRPAAKPRRAPAKHSGTASLKDHSIAALLASLAELAARNPETHADAPPPSDDQTLARAAGKIRLHLQVILKDCPKEIFADVLPPIDEDLGIELPLSQIVPQLASGVVEISSLRFIAALPQDYMRYFVVREDVKVTIPLDEIIKNLTDAEREKYAVAARPPSVSIAELAFAEAAPHEVDLSSIHRIAPDSHTEEAKPVASAAAHEPSAGAPPAPHSFPPVLEHAGLEAEDSAKEPAHAVPEPEAPDIALAEPLHPPSPEHSWTTFEDAGKSLLVEKAGGAPPAEPEPAKEHRDAHPAEAAESKAEEPVAEPESKVEEPAAEAKSGTEEPAAGEEPKVVKAAASVAQIEEPAAPAESQATEPAAATEMAAPEKPADTASAPEPEPEPESETELEQEPEPEPVRPNISLNIPTFRVFAPPPIHVSASVNDASGTPVPLAWSGHVSIRPPRTEESGEEKNEGPQIPVPQEIPTPKSDGVANAAEPESKSKLQSPIASKLVEAASASVAETPQGRAPAEAVLQHVPTLSEPSLEIVPQLESAQSQAETPAQSLQSHIPADAAADITSVSAPTSEGTEARDAHTDTSIAPHPEDADAGRGLFLPSVEHTGLIRPPIIRPVAVPPPPIFVLNPTAGAQPFASASGESLTATSPAPGPRENPSIPVAFVPPSKSAHPVASHEEAPPAEDALAPETASSPLASDAPHVEPHETKPAAPLSEAASQIAGTSAPAIPSIPLPPKIALSVPKLPVLNIQPASKVEAPAPLPETMPVPPPLPLARFDQDVLQTLFMTDEFLDLSAICRHVSALPGIQACVISRREESVHAGEEPEGFNFSELLAFAPGVTQMADRLQIGALKHFTLYAETHSVSFFERNGVCLCAVHRSRSFVPGVREKLVTVSDELSKL